MKKTLKIILVMILAIVFKNDVFGYSNKYFSIDIPNHYNFTQGENEFVIENETIETYTFDKANLQNNSSTIVSINIVRNPAKTALRRFTKETISKSKKEVQKNIEKIKDDTRSSEITCSKISHENINIGEEKYNALRIYNTVKILNNTQYYNYYYIIADNYIYIIIVVSPNDINANLELNNIIKSLEINDSINYGGEALLVWQDMKYYGKFIIPILVIGFVSTKVITKKIKKKRKNKIMDDIFKGIKH